MYGVSVKRGHVRPQKPFSPLSQAIMHFPLRDLGPTVSRSKAWNQSPRVPAPIFLDFPVHGRYGRNLEGDGNLLQGAPPDFRLSDVMVRLALPEERLRRDALMDRHHYLGFRRFAGRGLRHVFVWRSRWIGLAGWQSSAFKRKPRDVWIG